MKLVRIVTSYILMFALIAQPVFADPTAAGALGVAPEPISSPNELITVNFSQADIQSVFRILALKGDVNIVAGPEITGEVTLQLTNVPWESAFDTIVRTYGYTYEKEGNIYYVLTPESLQLRRESGSRTEVVNLQYANLDQVSNALSALVSGVIVETLPGTNQILMTATPANLEEARELINRIDVWQPQVHIDAKIVRTGLSESESLGISWNLIGGLSQGARRPTTFPFSEDPSARRLGKFLQRFDYLPTGQVATETTTETTSGGGQSQESTQDFGKGHSFPFVDPEEFAFGTLDFSQMSVVFNMLENRANTKILSNPRIVVLNNQEARVQAGREIGLPTFERNESTGSLEITGYEPRNDGIELRVTPHVNADKEIHVTVTPQLTRFLGFREVVAGSNVLSPEFETTVAETSVLINSGDTLVIGGLITESETESRDSVPYLGKIPLLGFLFRSKSPSKERAETIIFVTVTLADNVFNKKAIESWRKYEEEFRLFHEEAEKKKFSWFNKQKDKKESTDSQDDK